MSPRDASKQLKVNLDVFYLTAPPPGIRVIGQLDGNGVGSTLLGI